MVYISRIAPKKNLLFLLNELKSVPVTTNLKLDIFGPIEDLMYWNKCKDIIQNELKNISISYKGEIEFTNILTTISNYHFFILSTFGENFGHSIFESFAAGRPVIISNNTPWKNLEQKNIGWDLSITESGSFFKAIIKASKLNQRSFDKMCDDSLEFAHNFIEEADFIKKYSKIFN
jgi:glycosyltransferase involved in cell wall biosynthesis